MSVLTSASFEYFLCFASRISGFFFLCVCFYLIFFWQFHCVSHVALVRGQSFSVRFPRRVWTSVSRMPQDLATRSPTNVQFVLSWMKEWSTTLLQLSNLCPILRIPSPELSPCLEANAPTSLWTPPENDSLLAQAGFDYDHTVKPLRLLGARSIQVSVFVSVECPNVELIPFLKTYGKIKSDALRRLYCNEDSFSHIKRGLHVAEFLSLDKDLLCKIVTNGVEIHFKYTGQPITCYRCGSTEQVVQTCPQKARLRPPWILPRVTRQRFPWQKLWTLHPPTQEKLLRLRTTRQP